MTRNHELQKYLRDTGRYAGPIDGILGRGSRAAILMGMEDGPDTKLTSEDYQASAGRLGVDVATILAFAEVEANGGGFEAGKPKILFEPHRFSKMTNGRFDATNRQISYRTWGTRPYPRSLDGRYAQLLEAVGCDVWAGFAAASYGKFQIMGENHELAGYDNPWAFAFGMAYDEAAQLKAFERFLRHTGILVPLRAHRWADVARRYNGTGYAKNQYDVKLAQSYRKWSQSLEGQA